MSKVTGTLLVIILILLALIAGRAIHESTNRSNVDGISTVN